MAIRSGLTESNDPFHNILAVFGKKYELARQNLLADSNFFLYPKVLNSANLLISAYNVSFSRRLSVPFQASNSPTLRNWLKFRTSRLFNLNKMIRNIIVI